MVYASELYCDIVQRKFEIMPEAHPTGTFFGCSFFWGPTNVGLFGVPFQRVRGGKKFFAVNG